MKLTPRSIVQFLPKALLDRSIESSAFASFQTALIGYKQALSKLADQTEPTIVSSALKPFIDSFGYTSRPFDQAGQSGIDLAIMRGDKPAVIIEAKAPNASEMISTDDPHKKAFAEAFLYYARERKNSNLGIKTIIITDFYRWYVFKNTAFDQLYRDSKLRKIYDDYSSGKYRTQDFYDATLSHLKTSDQTLETLFFDIESFTADEELAQLFHTLSSQFLLAEWNPNDANKLNRNFYNELLYILGLTEKDDSGKKLITRANTAGSLYENIHNKLIQYGKNSDFEIVVGLMIVWLNRILFLKLLESQLISWNDDKSIKFLTIEKINDFDKLETLFFEILAKKPTERNTTCRDFDQIPYLNSSLFDIHFLEDKYLKISNLQDSLEMDYFTSTVLRDTATTKRSGKVSTLAYLFDFLDAYDYGTPDQALIANKELISSSVLGLIFEKLNGYKDGSFYTPSFITMYMSRETIRQTLIERFNTTKGWDCKNLTEIYNHISDKKEANSIINSLTICDPAVGSGHFLVSALNEIISIKSELELLMDESGKLLKEIAIRVENDELIISQNDGSSFVYKRGLRNETRIQKTLFDEKQRIIENSLFGVDINPNSVNICRLRLWIELLKHAYYREDGTLETLPNIDINIKSGNSLISRFGLTDEIRSNNIKHEIGNYKSAVKSYKYNLGSKKEILESIKNLKDMFRTSLKAEWKAVKTRDEKLKSFVANYGWDKLDDTLAMISAKRRYGQTNSLFGDEIDETKQAKALAELEGAQAKVEEIESGKIYENAFEWRFEFPEVLDDEGNFIGFDIVIGNPPYIDSEAMSANLLNERSYISSTYELAKGNWDIYIAFFDKAFSILRKNSGMLSFITPDKWISKPFGKALRELNNKKLLKIVKCGRDVFESAIVDSIVTIYQDTETDKFSACEFVENKLVLLNEIEKKDIAEDLRYDMYFSKNLKLLKTIDKHTSKISDFAQCEAACATSDAYKLKEYIKNSDLSYYDKDLMFKVINTGTIGKYISNWDTKKMTYLKDKYDYPIVIKKDFFESFTNTYSLKSKSKKIIIKGLTLLDACLDEFAEVIPGKSTLILANEDVDTLKFLLPIINSSLMIFYIKNKYSSSSYNGGISFTKDMINNFPIPQIPEADQKPFVDLVDQILALKASGADTTHLEREIDTLVYKLYNLTDEEIAIVEDA